MRNTRNELELIDENVVEVKFDVEVNIEDVDELELVLVGVLEEVDELDLGERGVVEVNVAGVVDVEVDVEDVDELELVLPPLVNVLGIVDDVAADPIVDVEGKVEVEQPSVAKDRMVDAGMLFVMSMIATQGAVVVGIVADVAGLSSASMKRVWSK
eukprot:5167812-Amphidinium_carterae.1